MTPEHFEEWLREMKYHGLAKSDSQCARLLGVSNNSLGTWKKKGTDTRTALACRALLHRLEKYGGE